MNVTQGSTNKYYWEKYEGKQDTALFILTNKEYLNIIARIITDRGWIVQRVVDLNKDKNFLLQNEYYKETKKRYDYMLVFYGL